MTPRWYSGNHVELLENGEEFFPRLVEHIEQARHEVFIETFILSDDKVGRELAGTLVRAARRGVRVELTVDAWGSRELGEDFLGELTSAGVCVHLFEEKPRWRLRVAWFRRLHRKIVAIDGRLAFIGGINFCEDHLSDYGRAAKQDYSVRIVGPVAREIHDFARRAVRPVHGDDDWPHLQLQEPDQSCGADGGSMQVAFIVRDNRRGHRTTIEKQYRAAIRQARKRLIIANAYFFPGHLLLREIRNAAGRGVDVRLIMPAEPDIRIARFGARLLHDYLLQGGVRIYEYLGRQFHGKLAVIDDDWVTVGSSNLDPFSLWLNLEANVVVRDEAFNAMVHDRLMTLQSESCREIARTRAPRRVFWRPAVGLVAFHALRRFPHLTGLLPAHRPRLTKVPGSEATPTRTRGNRERSELAGR